MGEGLGRVCMGSKLDMAARLLLNGRRGLRGAWGWTGEAWFPRRCESTGGFRHTPSAVLGDGAARWAHACACRGPCTRAETPPPAHAGQVLPFVSLCREKAAQLKDLLQPVNKEVGGRRACRGTTG